MVELVEVKRSPFVILRAWLQGSFRNAEVVEQSSGMLAKSLEKLLELERMLELHANSDRAANMERTSKEIGQIIAYTNQITVWGAAIRYRHAQIQTCRNRHVSLAPRVWS